MRSSHIFTITHPIVVGGTYKNKRNGSEALMSSREKVLTKDVWRGRLLTFTGGSNPETVVENTQGFEDWELVDAGGRDVKKLIREHIKATEAKRKKKSA